MAKKKSSARDMELYLEHQRFISAPAIKTKYPNVAEIHLTYIFLDEAYPRDKYQEHSRLLNSTKLALFEVDCSNYECIRGGFDLAQQIANMIRNKETESQGTKICQGWQDKERINKHRCLIKLDYKIHIQYLKV